MKTKQIQVNTSVDYSVQGKRGLCFVGDATEQLNAKRDVSLSDILNYMSLRKHVSWAVELADICKYAKVKYMANRESDD